MSTDRRNDLAVTEMHLKAFNGALAAFQAEVNAAKRDGKNPHFRTSYATLASVLEAVKPACRHGLSHTQICKREGDQLLLITTLRHREGHEVSSELPLVLTGDWQKFGSAYTYARRYALMGIYGIAASDDDDDGAAASAMAFGTGSGGRRNGAAIGAAKAVDPSPLEQRAQVISQSLNSLFEADPDAIKPLVESYRAAFQVPPRMPVARSLDHPDRLAWFEERLGLTQVAAGQLQHALEKEQSA